MIFRTAATTAALAIVLAVVGAAAGPQWEPDPVVDHVTPMSSDTTIGGQNSQNVRPIGTYQVTTSTVRIQLNGRTIEGVLRMPEGVGHTLPGVVFVHGAGTSQGASAFSDLATSLTSTGIATLVPNKRLDTYSTTHRDYVAMADDYDRSVRYLRTVPGVDPDRVGIYGESEGTWIMPIMEHEDPKIAFTALTSAPVVTPREQAAFAVDSYLRNTDVPQGVFRAIPRAVGMKLPGSGFQYVDFDVKPYLEQLKAPILVSYGTADPSMPIEEGAEEIIADAKLAGNDDVTVRYYGGANHGLKVQGVQGEPSTQKLDPDFPRDLSAWILSLPTSANAAPQIAGAQPHQEYLAERVPNTQWYGDGDVVIGAMILALALLVLSPLVLLGARVWKRARHSGPTGRFAKGLAGPVAWLGVGSFVTMVALLVYLVAVAQLALNYQKDGWVVQGGWIAVRLLGLATLVGGALLINRGGELRTRRKEAKAKGLERDGDVVMATGIAKVAMWGTIAAAVIFLLTLAYWGVYQLGI